MMSETSSSDEEERYPIYQRHWQDYNCAKADFTFQLEFRTPFNLLEVDNYYIKWGKLFVRPAPGDDELEFEPYLSPEKFEWKWPDHTEITDITGLEGCWNLDDEILKKYIEDSGHIEWEPDDSKFHVKERTPTPPIPEDTFKYNDTCVCEKKPNNDYPCLCDDYGPRELDANEAGEKLNEQREHIQYLQGLLREEKVNSSYWRDRAHNPDYGEFTEEEKIAFDKALAN